MTKQEILDKQYAGKPYSALKEKEVFVAMDEYAKQTLSLFGDWKLSNEIKYDRGDNPEWSKLSYSQVVDKFFKEVIGVE